MNQPTGGPNYRDIFVSYASEDRARVATLVHELTSHGFSIWFDVEQLRAGQQFNVLHEQIWNSKFFLAMISTSTFRAAQRWVMDEINTAITASNGVRPLTLVALRLEAEVILPPVLKSRKAIDLLGQDPKQEMELLVATLRGASLPATPVERFRAFIEALPVVNRRTAMLLFGMEIRANPENAFRQWFGAGRIFNDEDRQRIESEARGMRRGIDRQLREWQVKDADRDRILGAIDAGTRAPLIVSETRNAILDWLRHVDGEFIAFAGWLSQAEGPYCDGRFIANFLGESVHSPTTESHSLRSRMLGLLRRAIDSGLLEPCDENAYRRRIVPARELDRRFRISFRDACNVAALFELHEGRPITRFRRASRPEEPHRVPNPTQ